MEYNTQRKQLTLPEYGRNVQRMVDYLLTIEDRAKRTEQSKAVIQVMRTLSPQLKNLDDHERRLWDHLHIMSDFKLDVDSEYPVPNADEIHKAPERIVYPQHCDGSSHYGKLAPAMLKALAHLPESEERTALSVMTANQMKRSYLQWNKSAVEDSEILHDVAQLSQGRIQLTDDTKLADPSDSARRTSSSKKGESTSNGTRTNRRRRKKKR